MVQAREGRVNIRAVFIFARGNELMLGMIRIRIAYNDH